MPGSAIGRMIRSDTALRPKKRVLLQRHRRQGPQHQRDHGGEQRHLHAHPQRVPGPLRLGRHVTTSRSVKSCGGQAKDRLTLKELSTTSASGV